MLTGWGYKVGVSLTDKTISEVRRFLTDSTKQINARYPMVSVGPEFDLERRVGRYLAHP